MRAKKTLTGILSALAMVMLIVDSKTVIAGAGDAIDLCIRSLIPALFPFLVVSGVLTGGLSGGISLFAVGFLAGYPVGAKSTAESWRSGAVSREQAERLLAFCSNAGPAFLFGIIGPMFSQWYVPWLLWLIHILGAVVAMVIVSPVLPKSPCSKSTSVVQVLESSVKTMGIICGWVMIFRILIAFCDKWFLWVMPGAFQVIFSGFLELANGCIQLHEINLPGLRYLVAGVLLSIGGCCVTMQTVSVCQGLSLRWYFPGKTVQCAVSILLCTMTQFVFPLMERFISSVLIIVSMVLLISSMMLLRRFEKSSSNLTLVGV